MFFESDGYRETMLLKEMGGRESRILGLLKDLVELESPSHEKLLVDRCVDRVERECQRIGGKVRRHRRRGFGDLLEVRFGKGGKGRKPVMLLGHLDTVWEVGTLARMPYKVERGRVWGPG